ncbi:MAG TPA: NUDIX domain-containing protein [Burkholderiaceae bacterium]|nr:NUDIX domain-containing protein [Burkholderiaceae bacterium]
MSAIPPLSLDPAWQAALLSRCNRAPLRPRQPLLAGGLCIGSVEAALAQAMNLNPARWQDGPAWSLAGDVQAALDELTPRLRSGGWAGAWRNERLAVKAPDGHAVGAIERGLVRALGIATEAVHLLGLAPDGRHWIQRRSRTKANDPGLLDTLMGGMVSRADNLHGALERETWEETGLRLEQLQGLRHGGQVRFERPSDDAGHGSGYLIERIDWFVATVPEGVAPANQDGEVDEFLRMAAPELAARLHADAFTLEAARLLVAAQAAPG